MISGKKIDLSITISDPLSEADVFAIADRIRYVASLIEMNRRLEGYLFDPLNNKTGRFEVTIS
jgi:hypothetical protein